MAEIRTKKLINAPEDLIAEMIEGMVAAHPDMLRVAGPTGRAVVAVDGPRAGKVGVVIGGGSGHEPAFAGYVGRGLADAAAVGNVFASPAPAQIMDAARAVDGGAGVLFLYGNYTGDVMNFDMAAEQCEAHGTPARSVQVIDDVASAPRAQRADRRGVAGDFFVFKIAGAAAEAGRDLDACVAAAEAANAATASMGVALTPCSMPQTLTPNFEIPDGQMEVGMGLHGEPGIRTAPLGTADEVTDELMTAIVADLSLAKGDRAAVLVNGLGGTGQMELYVIHRRVAQILGNLGVDIHHAWVGEYATSLEMAGASITLMKLDDDLQALLDAPCRTPALVVGAAPAPASDGLAAHRAEAKVERVRVDRGTLATGGTVTPEAFRGMMLAVADTISEHQDELSKLDGVIGDGDHGVTMQIGWNAIRRVLDHADADATISELCHAMGDAFLNAVGASSGPLYATGLQMAGDAVADRLDLDGPAMAAWIAGVCDGIAARGGAEVGDKTMMDSWLPAKAAALQADGDALERLAAAAEAALKGRDATRDMESRRGRSKKLGARSVGHVDPGAASAALILSAMRDRLKNVD